MRARRVTGAGEVETPNGKVHLHALRVTFMGELGWELHYARKDGLQLHDAVFKPEDSATAVVPTWAGYNAVDSLSVEKGYKHWHEDIQQEDTPVTSNVNCGATGSPTS